MWHKQSFTQFWSQSDAYSRRSSLKLTYIHHPLVVCTHQICCAVAVPIALSQDRLLHGHNRLVNWTPCSRMRESKLTMSMDAPGLGVTRSSAATILLLWNGDLTAFITSESQITRHVSAWRNDINVDTYLCFLQKYHSWWESHTRCKNWHSLFIFNRDHVHGQVNNLTTN